MNKKLILLGLGVLAFQLLAPKKASCQDLANSTLWKITGKNAKASYLLGTVHVLPQSKFELKEKVTEAIGKTETMVLEMDITDPAMQAKMMRLAPMNGDTTLDMLISESEYQQLDSLLMNTMGMGLTNLKQMKPMIISSFLLSRYVGGQPASFETSLVQRAKKDSMKVVGLETIEEQMAIFDSISYTVQARELVRMVNEEDEMKELYNGMIDAYVAEDLNALHTLLEEEMDGEGMEEHLLNRRNRNWMVSIEEMIAEKPTFIAVGAGHLVGKSGVISLLRKAGYKVEPMME
jgi:uncharacterized protein YbaP (TraB family)